MHDLPAKLHKLADTIKRHPREAQILRDSAALLCRQHEAIECLEADKTTLRDELARLHERIYAMARTFAEASAALIKHDTETTDANTKLQSDLDAAKANAKTPEDVAAEQAIIDRAAVAVPETPAQV